MTGRTGRIIPSEPSPPRPPDDGTLYTLPGTDRTFTSSQIRGPSPADWYPGDHPPMLDIVANGREADVRACALCCRGSDPFGPLRP